jgi:hypothetical protein
MVTSEKRRMTLSKNATPPSQKCVRPRSKNANHNIITNNINKNTYKTFKELGMPDLSI